MPIKFACPHCQYTIEASRSHAGHRVQCPSCKQPAVVPSPQAAAPAPPPPPPGPEEVEIELEDVEDPARGRRRRKSSGGGVLALLAPPGNGPLRMLWLGLLLVMLSFTIKHLLVDVAITSVPGAMELPRLLAQKEAELFPIFDDVRELEDKMNERRFDELDRGRDVEDFREEEERRDKERKQLRDAREAAQQEADKIEDKYKDRIRKAELAAIESGAAGLGWIQRGIWVKILVDLPKLAGCLLIVLATMPIVSDPEQLTPVKAYAMVCSAIVLVYATLYAALAFFS